MNINWNRANAMALFREEMIETVLPSRQHQRVAFFFKVPIERCAHSDDLVRENVDSDLRS
uniref:Uncharacterized protein n=1 Tax=Plectus sambesii TaxID=2011161 RepID=A0A914VQL3_9BILA